MAGMAGFEPTHNGVKVRCLTAWRHPNMQPSNNFFAIVIILVGARSGVRTLDTLIKSQVLYQLSSRRLMSYQRYSLYTIKKQNATLFFIFFYFLVTVQTQCHLLKEILVFC